MDIQKNIDKFHHFVWTSWLVFCLVIIADFSTAVIVAVIAAFLKEWLDSNQPNNHWDWYDILAGMLGILFTWLIIGRPGL